MSLKQILTNRVLPTLLHTDLHRVHELLAQQKNDAEIGGELGIDPTVVSLLRHSREK